MRKLLLFTCLVPLLACSRPADRSPNLKETTAANAAALVSSYDLEVTFDGLTAFVQKDVDGKPAVWALLVKADYDPNGTPSADEVPPCAKAESPQTLPEDFPPHVAALRIRDAEVELNGVPIGGIVPLFFLDGLDLRFDTGVKNPTIDLKTLVSREIFASVLSSTADEFKTHDTINP